MKFDINESKQIILDIGSHNISCGTANLVQPITYPNLLGFNIYQSLKILAVHKKSGNQLFGNQLTSKLFDESLYNYIKPQCRGIICNFDVQMQLVESVIEELNGINSNQDNIELEKADSSLEEFIVTMTMQPFSPMKSFKRIFEIMMEYFGVKAFYPISPAKALQALSMEMFAKNKETSTFQLIVESSHSGTYCTPFFDQQQLGYATKRLEIGGRLLTNYLKELISFKQFNISNEYFLVNEIKESLCYNSLNFAKEMSLKPGCLNKHFILPEIDIQKRGYATVILFVNNKIKFRMNGKIICIARKLLQIKKEQLSLNQSLVHKILVEFMRKLVKTLFLSIGLAQNGISKMIIESIKETHPDLQNYFLENIILSGGNTFFPNFKERLYDEIRQESPQEVDVSINSINSKFAVYDGCRKINQQELFLEKAINKNVYQEIGVERLIKLYLK